MKSIIKVFTTLAKIILSIVNAILILIIVINILLLLSEHALKNAYPSIMDYTYLTVKENDKVLGLNKGDLLILDTRRAFTVNEIVYYQEDENKTELGKVTEINVSRVTIKNNKKEDNTTKGLVIGSLVVTIPKAGTIVDIIFQTKGLIVSIIILIITTILQNLLIKKTKKDNQPKPDFQGMKRYN